MNKVQTAIDFFDTVLTPLLSAMQEMDGISKSRKSISGWSKSFTHKDTEFTSSHNFIELTGSTALANNVQIMKIYSEPQMLFNYNSARPYRCNMNSNVSNQFLDFGSMSRGTVTLEGSTTPRRFVDGILMFLNTVDMYDADDIRARPEEISFELLLDMPEEYHIPFILSSLWAGTYPDIEGAFFCTEEYMHVSELCLSHLHKIIKREKEIDTNQSQGNS